MNKTTPTKSVREFIDDEYRKYSVYVLKDRAIPSMIDGLKPSARKVLYTAIAKARSKIKTLSLLGNVISYAGYHHGDSSLDGAISTMTAPWANNAPLLEGYGSFGDRFDHAAAAARYTEIKLSSVFDKFFVDNDILEADIDPENSEPLYYLPLIPWVLVNGTEGIAVGHASKIQPRRVSDVVRAVEKVIAGQELKDSDLPPFYASHKGKIKFDKALDKYVMHGVFKRLNTTEVQVTEIPISYERADYIKHLDHLEEKGRISHYRDRSSKDGYNFLIKYPRGKMPEEDERLEKQLGLTENLNENLTLIDEKDQLRIYTSVSDLVKDFVKFRIAKVKVRYEYYVQRDKAKLWKLENTLAFINMVRDKKISLNQSKQDLMSAVMQWMDGGEAQRVIGLPAYSFCQDKVDEIKDQIKEVVKDIATWRATKAPDAYALDIKGIGKC